MSRNARKGVGRVLADALLKMAGRAKEKQWTLVPEGEIDEVLARH